MEVQDLLQGSATDFASNPAVIHEDRRLSYFTLNQHVNRLSDRLASFGLEHGDRAALLIENSLEYLICYFAALRAGLVVVPLDFTLGPDWLRLMIDDCGARVLMTQRRFARKLPDVCADPSTLGHVIIDAPLYNLALPVSVTDLQSLLGTIEDTPTVAAELPGSARLDNLSKLWRRARDAKRDLAAIFYTSGSTGSPKGVMLSHRNLTANTVGTVEYLRLASWDRVMVILPFHYIYGNSLLLTHVAAGGCLVIDNRFTYPEAVLDTMEKEEVTGFSGVPSHYMILMNKTTFPRRDFPKLRYFTQAGGAMAPDVTRQIMQAHPDKELFIMYGQTEASPRATWLPPAWLEEKLGSVGVAVPGVEVRVVDTHGVDLPVGETGEIIIGGDSVMMGYWNQPEEQQLVLRDGWLYTGDLGHFDSDGCLYIVGRQKDIVKTGGRRVSVKDVEEVVVQHPCVAEVAVLGVPDPILGEALLALVVVMDRNMLNVNDLRGFCRLRLPAFKVPSRFYQVDELPKYPTGKVNRLLLKEQFCL